MEICQFSLRTGDKCEECIIYLEILPFSDECHKILEVAPPGTVNLRLNLFTPAENVKDLIQILRLASLYV